MLDIKFIIENPGLIKKGAAKKHAKVDVDKILKLYEERNEKLQKVEKLRARQNEQSSSIAEAKKVEKEKAIKEMTKIKTEIKSLEPEIFALEVELDQLAALIPNPPLDSVPD